MCRSSTHSTTMTWNCRGRSSTAERREDRQGEPLGVVERRPPSWFERSSACSSGTASARAQMSAMPSKRPQVTKAPTARKATSLTADSKAIAATMPSCRSARSRWRVPNTMAKAASASAT